METLALVEILKLVKSEAVFAVLFILLLATVWRFALGVINDYKAMLAEQRAESAKREEVLMTNLETITLQQGKISETLTDISNGMEKLEEKVERNFLEVWRELRNKS